MRNLTDPKLGEGDERNVPLDCRLEKGLCNSDFIGQIFWTWTLLL